MKRFCVLSFAFASIFAISCAKFEEPDLISCDLGNSSPVKVTLTGSFSSLDQSDAETKARYVNLRYWEIGQDKINVAFNNIGVSASSTSTSSTLLVAKSNNVYVTSGDPSEYSDEPTFSGELDGITSGAALYGIYPHRPEGYVVNNPDKGYKNAYIEYQVPTYLALNGDNDPDTHVNHRGINDYSELMILCYAAGSGVVVDNGSLDVVVSTFKPMFNMQIIVPAIDGEKVTGIELRSEKGNLVDAANIYFDGKPVPTHRTNSIYASVDNALPGRSVNVNFPLLPTGDCKTNTMWSTEDLMIYVYTSSDDETHAEHSYYFPYVIDTQIPRNYFATKQLYDLTPVAPHYVDCGTDWGEGTLANGVIWAPVNCGTDVDCNMFGKLYQWGRSMGTSNPNYPISEGYPVAYNDMLGDICPAFKPIWEGENGMEQGQYLYGIEDMEQAGQGMLLMAVIDDMDYDPTECWGDWICDARKDFWNEGTSQNPVKGQFDPCPEGWRLPTPAEFESLKEARITEATGYPKDALKCYGWSYSPVYNTVFFPNAGLWLAEDPYNFEYWDYDGDFPYEFEANDGEYGYTGNISCGNGQSIRISLEDVRMVRYGCAYWTSEYGVAFYNHDSCDPTILAIRNRLEYTTQNLDNGGGLRDMDMAPRPVTKGLDLGGKLNRAGDDATGNFPVLTDRNPSDAFPVRCVFDRTTIANTSNTTRDLDIKDPVNFFTIND